MDAKSRALRILIVHFNTPELTARLVRELVPYTPNGREVYIHVLDNNSTPQNLELLRCGIAGLRNVVLDISEDNLGFGEGVNRLMANPEIEDVDLLWLLNSDMELTDGALAQMEAEMERGRYAVASPLIFRGNDNERRIWYCGGTIRIRDLRVAHQFCGSPLTDAPTEVFETEFITGAAPMMFASTFRSLGGFPAGYFLYWEDTYLCWKARNTGLRLGVVPAARVWHAVGASSGSGASPIYYYWSTRNRFLFARDIGVPQHRLVFGRGGAESLRQLVAALREPEGRFPKARAVIRGIVDGLRLEPE